MRIAVTGREGQIARCLVERAPLLGHEIVLIGRPALDLAGHADAIRRSITEASPDVIISAAAYTAVDRAESEPELAFAVNEGGARHVAEAASAVDVPLLHLSTDYVFDGTKEGSYLEIDPPRPQGVYGASKLAGEQAVLEAHPNTAVLRTAWVYSPFGANFVKTMLRLAAERDEVAVVADQHGNPTNALDIADGLLRVATNLVVSEDMEQRGIFHMTARGEATWADFAQAIFSASANFNGSTARVRPITSAEYPTPAKRPFNSCLDCSKLERVHGVRLPEWQRSVSSVVHRLVFESKPTRVSHQ